MQEGNSDGFNFFFFEYFQYFIQGGQVDFLLYLTLVVNTFIKFKTQITFNKGSGFSEIKVKQVRSITTGYFQYIAKSPGGDQCSFYTLALGDGIDNDGRTMSKELYRSCIKLGAKEFEIEILSEKSQ